MMTDVTTLLRGSSVVLNDVTKNWFFEIKNINTKRCNDSNDRYRKIIYTCARGFLFFSLIWVMFSEKAVVMSLQLFWGLR